MEWPVNILNEENFSQEEFCVSHEDYVPEFFHDRHDIDSKKPSEKKYDPVINFNDIPPTAWIIVFLVILLIGNFLRIFLGT